MSHSPKAVRRLALPFALCGAMAFTLACGAKLPAVLSSTPDEVSVEFKEKDSVSSSRELADKSCAKFEKVAEFEDVNSTASGESRVAKYKCVPPEGQRAADAQAAKEAARLDAEAKVKAETEAARAAAEAISRGQAAANAAQASATSGASGVGEAAASAPGDAATAGSAGDAVDAVTP